MTRIVRRIAGTTVLLTGLALTGPAEAADRTARRGAASPAWGQPWEAVWQRVLSAIGVGFRPTEETRERKGAGIDPNGAVLEDPMEPILTKKGAGIDPNG